MDSTCHLEYAKTTNYELPNAVHTANRKKLARTAMRKLISGNGE